LRPSTTTGQSNCTCVFFYQAGAFFAIVRAPPPGCTKNLSRNHLHRFLLFSPEDSARRRPNRTVGPRLPQPGFSPPALVVIFPPIKPYPSKHSNFPQEPHLTGEMALPNQSETSPGPSASILFRRPRKKPFDKPSKKNYASARAKDTSTNNLAGRSFRLQSNITTRFPARAESRHFVPSNLAPSRAVHRCRFDSRHEFRMDQWRQLKNITERVRETIIRLSIPKFYDWPPRKSQL